MKIKKTILLVFLFSSAVVFFQCNSAEKKKDNQTEEPAQKDVKPVAKEKPTLVYDDNGNITERHGYSYRKTDGSIRSRDSYYYTFDDSNNVITEIKESYHPDGSRNYKNVNYYKYDDRNLKTDLVFESYDENDAMLRTAHHSYKFNGNGHKIEDIGYDAEGSVISRIIMNPDETGLLNSEEYIYYDEKGEITDHKKYYYTEFGLEKEVDLMEEK